MATEIAQFKRNVQAYQHDLRRLLDSGAEGKYVLLRTGEVCGVFDSNAEARQAGHTSWGMSYFLTKEVLRSDLEEQYLDECRA